MPSIDAGGTELHYLRAGAGEPMLLIQGMSATHLTWGRPFLSPLEESFKCVVFDNRGMGLSGPAEMPFTTADLAGDTVGLLDALGIESAHVVGISMGGMIAQELALAHPERIRTLTLGATYCGGPEGTLMAPEDLRMLGAAMASGSREQVLRAMWEINISPGFREDEARFAEFCEMANALPAPQAGDPAADASLRRPRHQRPTRARSRSRPRSSTAPPTGCSGSATGSRSPPCSASSRSCWRTSATCSGGSSRSAPRRWSAITPWPRSEDVPVTRMRRCGVSSPGRRRRSWGRACP